MMKKAVVIGGSNGIGLAICKQLIQSGYYVHVLDVVGPESEAFGVEIEISIPSFTGYTQEATNPLAPFTSTKHTRHEPLEHSP